jgi:flagellin
MALAVNTNTASEHIQRILEETQRNQAKSLERLTTGVRINSARDDASGLSLSTNLSNQLQGLTMATNNANDGINMIQTADSALEDSTELLQRMRELGLQSMNATYSSAQRGDMDTEFQQLNSELNRIASVTKFNQIQLLKGVSQKLQVGWEIGVDNALYMSGFTLSGVAASIKTAATASNAVAAISTKMGSIQTQRARWGAMVNRLESAVSNMNNISVQTKDARSRLQDTVYVAETANHARMQVLQQAGMAMLAQANQSPQNVMSLLR